MYGLDVEKMVKAMQNKFKDKWEEGGEDEGRRANFGDVEQTQGWTGCVCEKRSIKYKNATQRKMRMEIFQGVQN
jgi:hypothetical protein